LSSGVIRYCGPIVKAEVVIAGAGIAGVSTAYHLAVRHGVRRVVLCDPGPPLSLTSDKSTECYRNWWPQPAMVALMNRSIDLLDEFGCGLTRRGYAYFTASREHLEELASRAKAVSEAGAGKVRMHEPFVGPPPCEAVREWDRATTGADLVTDPDLIHRLFPAVGRDVLGALHVRRAGWLDAQQLGARLLEEARSAGVELCRHAVVSVRRGPRGVAGVDLDDGSRIDTPILVLAAGPLIDEVVGLLGESLPVHAELHLKVAFKDHLGVVPRDAPLMIWDDPQRIPWERDEEAGLREHDPTLLEMLPAGCHLRPEGGADSPWVLGLWEFRHTVMAPVFPVPVDPMYPEVVVRGLTRMIPGLDAYRDRFPKATVDGGYYLRTPENLPLIGPLRTQGAFVIGALSGFGIMASQAAAELVSLHITGEPPPSYADAFRLERFDDPAYLETLSADTGQL
jgi:glycine/D-amino acid oxidase-like deaminating enzyme